MIKKTLILITLALTIKTCIDGDPLCARCGGDRCSLCYQGYTNFSGICVENQTLLTNCLSYETNSVCKLCNYGYKVDNGNCVKISLSNCLKFDVNGNCSICNGSELPEDGACEDGDSCEVDNCAVCSSSGQERCQICKKGLVLYPSTDEDGKLSFECVSGAPNCKETMVNEKHTCLECSPNYYYKYGKCHRANYAKITLNYEESSSKIFGLLGFVFMLLLN